MVSLLALLATSTVSYSGPAQPLEQLLPKLGSAWGISMRAEGSLAQDVAVVSVDEVTFEDFRSRMEAAFTGSWSQEGGTWVLRRNEVKDREEAQAELARLAKRLGQAIADFVGPMRDGGTLTSQEAEDRLTRLAELNDRVKAGIQTGTPVGVDMGGTPQERLMARVLKALNPGELASLPAFSRTVFSTAPNRMQRPLPPEVSRHLAAFAQEYGIWQAVVDRFRPTDEDNVFVDFGSSGPLKYPIAKLFLVASKWSDAPAVSLELKVVDQKGRIVASSVAGLEAAPPPVDAPEPTLDGDPIPFSKATLEIAAMRTGLFRDPGMGMTSDDLRAKLLNPETHDPLSFGVSEALLGLAKVEKKNLIACVPDSAFDLTFTSPTMRASQVRHTLDFGETLTLADDSNWLVARPGWPHRSRLNRTSRSQLGQLLRELDRSSGGCLGPLSKFASATPGNGPSSIVVNYLSMSEPSIATMLDPSSWELLRLYATLSPQQRQAQERIKLRVAELDRKARAALHRMLFFSPNSVPMGAFETAAQFEESGGEAIEPDSAEMIGSEPTEAMPNGVPENATFFIDGVVAQVALTPGGTSYTAEDLGMQLAMRERPELFPYVTSAPMPAKYHLVNRTSLLMTLGFNLEAVASFMLNDHSRSQARWVPLAELPQAFREAVDKAKREARESFRNMSGQGVGGGGGSNIPPS